MSFLIPLLDILKTPTYFDAVLPYYGWNEFEWWPIMFPDISYITILKIAQ